MSQDDLTRVCRAISGLVELAETELISPACPDPPIEFHKKLREDIVIARQFLREIRIPTGRFFLSAGQRRPNKRTQAAEARRIEKLYIS